MEGHERAETASTISSRERDSQVFNGKNEKDIEASNSRDYDATPEKDDEIEELGDERRQDEQKGAADACGEGNVLQKVKSKMSMKSHKSRISVNNVGAIPNGGLRAWLQVLGAFFLFFNTWGIINTFGVFQTYYETSLLQDSTPSSISWIGSLQAFLLMLVGALTGPVYDAGHFRFLLFTGCFFVVFGMMMLSLCKEYYQVFLAQAICVGLGTGFLFVPSVAILSTYFSTRIASAMGLAASGSSLGGVLYPIIFHNIVGSVGFPWTVRIIGFIILGTLLVPIVVMKVRVLPAAKRSLLDLPAFKEPPYALFNLGGFLGFTGLYAPFFYVQLYALTEHITKNNDSKQSLNFYLLSILNAASIFGRILPNFIADKAGPFNVMVPCACISGLLSLCLIAIHDVPGIVIFCIFYGFFSGAFVSLPPTILVALSPDRGKIGTRMGMSFACISVGVLVGTPIAGAILRGSGFTAVWVFGGVLPIVGGLIMAVARGIQAGWTLRVKA